MILLPSLGWAFGADGHRIVGHIAHDRLCESGREAVSELLDGDSLGEAGLWADKIRGYNEWDYAKPWHFINIPDGTTLQEAKRSKEGDVLWAIHEMSRRLDDPKLSKKEHAQALKFLIHFVADVHQPLHVGRYDDRGGNRVKVTYFRKPGLPPGKTNLHAYWDSAALELIVADPETYAQQLTARVKSLQGWQPGTPEDWVNGSMDLRPEVYDFYGFEGGETEYLGSQYLAKTALTLRRQLTRAGVRLGAVLSQRYCSSLEAASQQASQATADKASVGAE